MIYTNIIADQDSDSFEIILAGGDLRQSRKRNIVLVLCNLFILLIAFVLFPVSGTLLFLLSLPLVIIGLVNFYAESLIKIVFDSSNNMIYEVRFQSGKIFKNYLIPLDRLEYVSIFSGQSSYYKNDLANLTPSYLVLYVLYSTIPDTIYLGLINEEQKIVTKDALLKWLKLRKLEKIS